MDKKATLIIFFFLFVQLTFAQNSDIRERVYIQTNDNTFISGETLSFSIFVISHKTQLLSSQSNIIYIELIGNNGSVFKQKLLLKNGRASGSFFINSLIQTGHYKLIASTRWMRNFNDFFELPIEVINPFEDYKLKISEKNLSFKLLPESKEVVANIPNNICFKISNTEYPAETYEAKIIGDNSEEIINFNFNDFGFACQQFIPEKDQKAIITDRNGNISIFPLKYTIEEGTKLVIEEDDIEIKVTVKSSDSNNLFFNLNIINDELLRQESLRSNQPVTFKKSDFKPGLIKLILRMDEVLVDKRQLYISDDEYSSPILVKENYLSNDSVTIYLPIPKGNYSISVRKVYDNFQWHSLTATDSKLWFMLDTLKFETIFLKNTTLLAKLNAFKTLDNNVKEVNYLPESRNELIQGRAYYKNGKEYSNKPLILSFPGKNSFQNNIINTDDKGNFLFHFKPDSYDRTAYISSINIAPNISFEYESKYISIDSIKTIFPEVNLDSSQILDVKERSIRNQILNAYNITNSINKLNTSWQPQIDNYRLSYDFDNYKRFDNLEQHIIEYINLISVKNNKVFIGELNVPIDSTNQLILLDGLPVDPEKILEINPYLVQSIHIENSPIYLGKGVFSGVMLLKSKNEILADYNTEDYAKLVIKGLSNLLEVDDNWYIPNSDNNQPDLREQLYWQPELRHSNDNSAKITFKTSDVKGKFLLKIDGFSDDGRAVSKNVILTVQ